VKKTPEQHNERELIEQCIHKDHKASKMLYDMYKNKVFSIAVRMLGDFHDAEDAAQDIFIKIFQTIDRFRGESAFSTWVYKIAVNTSIEHLRKRKKHNKTDSFDSDDYSYQIMDDKNTPNMFGLIMENEINELPAGYKTVFILHAVEGFKHNEIAGILNITPGTSRSQFFQAKSILRKQLLPFAEVLRNEL